MMHAKVNPSPQAFNGSTQPFNGSTQPFNGSAQPFNGSTQPFNGSGQAFDGRRDSTRPIRALSRGLDVLTELNRLERAAINTLAAAVRLPRTMMVGR